MPRFLRLVGRVRPVGRRRHRDPRPSSTCPATTPRSTTRSRLPASVTSSRSRPARTATAPTRPRARAPRPACVIMKSGVTLRGAGTAATIIDAQLLGRGIFVENVTDCRIENLQVRSAYAAAYGAGILLRQVGADVRVTDVLVTLCTDGGVICYNHASPILTRVDCVANTAKQGGGLAIEEQSSPRVRDCHILDNHAPSGAGVFIRNGSDPAPDRLHRERQRDQRGLRPGRRHLRRGQLARDRALHDQRQHDPGQRRRRRLPAAARRACCGPARSRATSPRRATSRAPASRSTRPNR